MYKVQDALSNSDLKGIEDPQLPGESNKAYSAYCAYRSMSPPIRTLRRLSQINPQFKMGSLGNWSTRFDWQERVDAWDKAVRHRLVLAAAEQLDQDLMEYLSEELKLAVRMRERIEADIEIAEDSKALHRCIQSYMLVREIFKENFGFYLDNREDENAKE